MHSSRGLKGSSVGHCLWAQESPFGALPSGSRPIHPPTFKKLSSEEKGRFHCLWQGTSKRDKRHGGEVIHDGLMKFCPLQCKQAQNGAFWGQ